MWLILSITHSILSAHQGFSDQSRHGFLLSPHSPGNFFERLQRTCVLFWHFDFLLLFYFYFWIFTFCYNMCSLWWNWTLIRHQGGACPSALVQRNSRESEWYKFFESELPIYLLRIFGFKTKLNHFDSPELLCTRAEGHAPSLGADKFMSRN